MSVESNHLAERIALLKKMAVFGALQDDSLKLILSESAYRAFSAGQYIVLEGERGDSLFVLESGTVVIERSWEDEVVELNRLHAGDCFGEMTLIDFRPRSASVKAYNDCVAIEIPSRVLQRLHQTSVAEYAMIMMNLGREVSRRLRLADERLFQLQQRIAM